MKKTVLILCLLLSACGEENLSGEAPPGGENNAKPLESPQTVVVSPTLTTLTTLGDKKQLDVSLQYKDGTKLSEMKREVVDPSSEKTTLLRWVSSAPDVVAIDPSGIIEAKKEGEALISASLNGVTGNSTVRVIISGENSSRSSTPLPPITPDDGPVRVSVGAAGTIATPCPLSIPASLLPSIDQDLEPYASRLVSYRVGLRGGFNEQRLPEIVLGPPHGAGNAPGGFDVFSLGLGGEITLEFTDFIPVDGPGPDLIVFENVFSGFFEPAVVSVSPDGLHWREFPCQRSLPNFEGCAGTHPVYANPERNDISPTDPSVAGGTGPAGGDAYDLADIGLCQARFIRIVDINGCSFYNDQIHCSDAAVPGVLGFDLDAVSVVNGIVP
ncbi:MAG: hypothetical protein Q7S98_05690 [Deltaproteobacteria bacterium]|nr:hypothetical protein [Deltaproteobacteria bacterium]